MWGCQLAFHSWCVSVHSEQAILTSSGQIAIKLGSDNDEHRKDFCDPPDHQDRNFPLNNTHLILNTGRDGSGVKLLI